MNIDESLFRYPFFTLLTSAVASGKTRMIVEFYRANNYKVLYLSPLRALANEVYSKLKSQEEKNIFLAGGDESLDCVYKNFLEKSKSFLVITAELLNDDFLDALSLQKENVIIVIDEFHLIYYWGKDFRVVLHERFLSLLYYEFSILAITATMDKKIINEMEIDLKFHDSHYLFLDFGNHQLHRPPQKIWSYYGLNSSYVKRAFWRELKYKKENEILLLFCAYRSEVDEYVQRAKRLGFTALGCVGGEVEKFLADVETNKENIDVIISTTTLSHGVNLPEIHKVFIAHEVKNYDFWLQMIGRGGRQGASYKVYSCDKFHVNLKQSILDRMKIYFYDFIGIELED